MTLKSPAAALFVGITFLLMTTLAGMAEARRGGGGGGGARGGGSFNRSSPASGGGFSARSTSPRQAGTVQRPSQGTGQRSTQASTRQVGTDQRSAQQQSASERQGQRQAATGEQRSAQQQSASERQGQRQDAAKEQQGNREDYRDDSREDWQQHQNQNREDWQDFAEDEYHGGDWDDHWHGDDDVAAAFVVGTAVGVTAGAIAASSQPTYVTTLPCTGTTVIVNGATYYQCQNTWYTRGYQSGAVVYIAGGPPPGF